jgi:membrane associated rhomboid family serine protease
LLLADQALVSKGLLLLTGSFSFGALLARKVGLFTLDLDAVARGEVWRLFTHQLVWSSSSELVLGSMLLYTLRLFERQFGARKFAACALFLQLVATAVQASVLAFSRGVVGASGWSFAPGPYALCFGT